ncbi:hypothetical protein D3C72_1306870 [compost metagenome]
MHMWSALHSWEDRTINKRRNVLKCLLRLLKWVSYNTFRKNEATTWSTQRLMGSSRNDMETEIKRILCHTASDQASDMGHVGHKKRANFITNSSKLFIVEFTWVRAKTSKNNLWLML